MDSKEVDCVSGSPTRVVLLSAPYMLGSLERFGPLFERCGIKLIVPSVTERLEEENLLEFAGQFDGAICGDDRYTARVIENCVPRLKVISKWGTGVDSIDLDTAAKHGVRVANTPNAFTSCVADTVMGYILAFARRLPWCDKSVKSHLWQKQSCRSLNECTIGVIGVGNIGRAVLQRAHAFGSKLLGNDIKEVDADFLKAFSVEMTSLKDLLSRSDYVSVNCTLNPTSHHLLGSHNLMLMKTSAVLINTARGPIVDEAALVQALQNDRMAGAALDVYEVEPVEDNSPLLTMDNTMLAPHNANSSAAAWERVHWNTIRNLLTGLNISLECLGECE